MGLLQRLGQRRSEEARSGFGYEISANLCIYTNEGAFEGLKQSFGTQKRSGLWSLVLYFSFVCLQVYYDVSRLKTARLVVFLSITIVSLIWNSKKTYQTEQNYLRVHWHFLRLLWDFFDIELGLGGLSTCSIGSTACWSSICKGFGGLFVLNSIGNLKFYWGLRLLKIWDSWYSFGSYLFGLNA